MGLEALTGALWTKYENPIEVIKRNNQLLGSTLTFQLLMGHEVDDFETLSASFTVDEEGNLADLSEHKITAKQCDVRFIDLVNDEKTKLREDPALAGSAPVASPKS
jgi:hypothetical protein